jgi:hypothetical protein
MTPLHDASQEPSVWALARPALTMSVLLLLAASGGAVLAGETAAPADHAVATPSPTPALAPAIIGGDARPLVRPEPGAPAGHSAGHDAVRHRDRLTQPGDSRSSAQLPVAGEETGWTFATIGCTASD